MANKAVEVNPLFVLLTLSGECDDAVAMLLTGHAFQSIERSAPLLDQCHTAKAKKESSKISEILLDSTTKNLLLRSIFFRS
ncbi:hypothetical protein [Novosphingobium sp. Chol11]|uniref:hypothetical protein n=1 Tax=Novosphingobium sp. Chol11 TaxID=1385763 RepID=UPI0011425160|nr:hypothetical protein [Novosphingobium sp. Chol11]